MMEQKFIQIFTGLRRDYGVAYLNSPNTKRDPDTGKLKPEYGWAKKDLRDQDYLDHLLGIKSIGIQACDDDALCRFGAIDIDEKNEKGKSYDNFNHKKYLDIITKYNLPLVPTLSKSGGMHLWVFLKEPAKAIFVRKFLEGLLCTLDLPITTEIFPAQTELGKDPDGSLSVGQFINLPYVGKKDRVALNPNDGTQFTFEQFIKVVEANLHTSDELEKILIQHTEEVLKGGGEEFIDGPPCLQAMTRELLTDERDRFLYNYHIFAKKKYPDKWEKMTIQAAQDYFAKDGDGFNEWTDTKVKQKIKSWRKDSKKGYTCTKDPIVRFCRKPECYKRPYGKASDAKNFWPESSGLQQVNFVPEPEYRFNVQLNSGKKIQVKVPSSKIFYVQKDLAAIITKYTGVFLPPMAPNDYNDYVERIFPPKEIIEPPKGTTPEEALEEALIEYVNGPQAKTYAAFKTGAVLVEGEHVFFKQNEFYDFLKNKEWKERKDRTFEILKNKFDIEFGVQKRFPKKTTDTKSYDPIPVMQIKIDVKDREESMIEVIPLRKEGDIF